MASTYAEVRRRPTLVVIGFTLIILAAIGCRFFKPELLRSVSALQGSA